jgi:GntR family transcriptional repressor for pyruvate dehydrogenase complex
MMSTANFLDHAPATILARVEAAAPNARARARLLAAEIHGYLATAIRSGALVQGAQIPTERALAARFAANRKTIREALARLEQEGMITRRVGSGGFVSWVEEGAVGTGAGATLFQTPSVSPLDVIEARRVVEPNMCDFAVARATEEDFERMSQRLADMAAARDLVVFRKAGYAFHLEIARATRNPLLVVIYEMLIAARVKAGWGTLIPLNDRQEQRDAQIADNQALLTALRARDAETARRLSFRILSEMISTIAAFPPGC